MLKVRQIKYDTSADGQPITRLQIRHYSREVGKVHQVGFDNTTVVFTATNVGDQIYQLNKHHLGISFGVNNIIYAKAFYKDGEWTYNEFVEAWDNILKSYVLLNKHEQLIWNSIKIGEWTYNEFVEAWDNILKSYVLLNKHEQLIWSTWLYFPSYYTCMVTYFFCIN
eukprot:691960_1